MPENKNNSLITFNWVALRRSAPSAAARRLRIFTLFVRADIPLQFDQWAGLLSDGIQFFGPHSVPLTRALSAELAFTDHLCHFCPSIEVLAHPSDLGHKLICLDLADFIFDMLCLPTPTFEPWRETFKTFEGREDGKSSARGFLFDFETLLVATKERTVKKQV